MNEYNHGDIVTLFDKRGFTICSIEYGTAVQIFGEELHTTITVAKENPHER